jgi:hypothetical protein
LRRDAERRRLFAGLPAQRADRGICDSVPQGDAAGGRAGDGAVLESGVGDVEALALGATFARATSSAPQRSEQHVVARHLGNQSRARRRTSRSTRDLRVLRLDPAPQPSPVRLTARVETELPVVDVFGLLAELARFSLSLLAVSQASCCCGKSCPIAMPRRASAPSTRVPAARSVGFCRYAV